MSDIAYWFEECCDKCTEHDMMTNIVVIDAWVALIEDVDNVTTNSRHSYVKDRDKRMISQWLIEDGGIISQTWESW